MHRRPTLLSRRPRSRNEASLKGARTPTGPSGSRARRRPTVTAHVEEWQISADEPRRRTHRRGRWPASGARELGYARAMRGALSTAIDRWLGALIVVWARREWPA